MIQTSQFFALCPNSPSRRILRLLRTTLSILLLTAVPALGDPITVKQVVQTLSGTSGTIDLRLNTTVAQDPAKGTQQSGPRTDNSQTVGIKTEPIVPGGIVTVNAPQIGIEGIEEGEVEGTICDCGEIMLVGGGFPKWPFFLLGAIPLAFIDFDNEESPKPTPTPSPQPTQFSNPTPTPTPQVPEPASLFLLGTGLVAAGGALKRRYAKSKAAEQTQTQEGE